VRFDSEWHRNHKRCWKHVTFYDKYIGCLGCLQDAANRSARRSTRNRIVGHGAIAAAAVVALGVAFGWAKPHAKSLDAARVPESVRLYDLGHGVK
jgi:hypothetical protein